jgi:pilus assembly protein FimV
VNKTDKTTIFKTSLLVALLGASFGAQAAGLGKLVVYSAIGQPLNAEVAVTATVEELNGLSARLAPHGAFSDAGIELTPVLTNLRFNVVKTSDGQPVLRLTTDAPLNEPFLHFLVELNWTSGRMVREYTFLLDPPEMLQATKPASVVAPAAPVARPLESAPPAKAAPLAKPAPALPVASAAAPVGEIKVKAGDTLSKIAREHKYETVSLDQMLVALFNSNREVFDGANMNRLRAGKILRMPDAVEVAQVDAGDARKLIVSQAADFNAYRRRLAEAVATAPAAEAATRQEVSGKIVPEVEGKAAAPAVKDKLEVSRTETAKVPAKGADKGSLEEDLIARDKALREAADRIAQLEKNLENLKHLVELKSKAGAEMQQQAQVAAAPKPQEDKKPEPVAAKPAEPAAPAADQKPVEQTPAKPAEEAAPAEAAKPATPAKPQPKPAVKKPAPPPPEPSFVEDNPELVFGGGGLIALLLGYFGYAAWRKKKQARAEADFEESPSVSESELAARSGAMFGAASENVDSGEVSIQGDFSEGGVLTTEESVDPVAEADVLMAYGRDGQAEEILKEGLKADPSRGAIHLKLLELYANRKDVGQFEVVAQALHALNDGQGADWEKASVMARDLGVTGDLFPSVVTATEVPADEVAEAPVPDVAEQANETVIFESPPPVAAEEIAPAPAADDSSLDFDLDLGTTSGPAVAAAAEAAAKPAAEEAMSLDFDFDLGTPEPAAVADAADSVEPAAEAAPAAEADGNVIDFSLDAGAPAKLDEAPAIPEMAAEAPEEAGGIDFSLDIGSAEESGEAGAESVPTAVAAEAPKDIDVDFDLELGGAPAADLESAPPELDLADISLDLGESGEAAAAPELEIPAIDIAPDASALPEAEGLPELSLDLPSSVGPAVADATPVVAEEADDPEVATKLELAQAYEEMGDREGARELLNEVLGEGSAAQRAQAQARLDQLGA